MANAGEPQEGLFTRPGAGAYGTIRELKDGKNGGIAGN